MTGRLPAELESYAAQYAALQDWLSGLPSDALEPASVLPDWDARTLREHLAGSTDSTRVQGVHEPVTALDFVRARLLDLVVQCDDLSRTYPDRDPVPLHRPALATAVRALAELFTRQARGRSVELRVPPFVAVQAVPGPRHTRGTPSNVVETDPLTWLRVATGRLPFADAISTGAIRASGGRTDLSPYLPVLR